MLGDTLATSCVQPREDALNNLVLVQNPLLATANDSLGFYHNLIIYNTLEKIIVLIIGKVFLTRRVS